MQERLPPEILSGACRQRRPPRCPRDRVCLVVAHARTETLTAVPGPAVAGPRSPTVTSAPADDCDPRRNQCHRSASSMAPRAFSVTPMNRWVT